MKKILLLMFILMIGFSSAAEFDNVKSYSEELKAVTITNAFGMGEVIGQAQLTSEQHIKVGLGYQKVAQFDIWAYDDYSDALKDFTFTDLKKKEKVNRDYDLKMLTYENKTFTRYYFECDENDQNCEKKENGTYEKEIEVWTKITPADLKKAELLTVGVFTNVEEGDLVDWIPVIFGVEIDEWAIFEAYLYTDLISWYDLNETSGDVVDFQGNNTGTLTGGTRGLPGVINNSFNFTGGTDHVDIGDLSMFEKDAYTISIWVNVNASVDNPFFSEGDTGTNPFCQIKTDATGHPSVVIKNSGGTNLLSITSSRIILGDGWVHVVFVDDNGNYTLYLDNVSDMSGTYTQATDATTKTVFGSSYRSGSFTGFTGAIDLVGLWDRALNVSEINNLYNDGAGVSPSQQTGPVDNPPTVILDSPANDSTFTTSTITFNATAYDDINLTNVTLNINEIANITNSSGLNNSLYTWDLTLGDGDWNYSFTACDNSSQCTTSDIRIFSINTNNQPNNTLNYPTGNISIAGASVNFLFTPIDNLGFANATMYLQNITGGANYTYNNQSTIINNTQNTITLTNISIGHYSWYMQIFDSNGINNISSTEYFVVENQTITTELIEPSNDSNLTDSEVDFNLSSTSVGLNMTNVTLYIYNSTDGSVYLTNTTNISGTGTNYSQFTNTLPDAVWNWNAETCAEGNGCYFADSNFTFSIDTTGPNVNITNPKGLVDFIVFGNNQSLNFTSDESVQCDYAYRDELLYANDSNVWKDGSRYGWLYVEDKDNQNITVTGYFGAGASPFIRIYKDSLSITGSYQQEQPQPASAPGFYNNTFELDLNDDGWHYYQIFAFDGGGLNYNDIDSFRLVNPESFAQYNVSINCSESASFEYVQDVNNISLFAQDSFGNIGNDTSEFEYRVVEMNQTFNNQTTEGSTETFEIYVETNEQISLANFIYDGTEYSADLYQLDTTVYIINTTIIIPGVGGSQNISFYWEFNMTSGVQVQSDTNQQYVQDVGIGTCDPGELLLINYSLFDEEFQTDLIGDIEIDMEFLSSDGLSSVANLSTNYTDVSFGPVCISNATADDIDFLINSVVRYTSEGYAEEFYHIQRGLLDNTTLPINISLYDLSNNDSTVFSLSYKGVDFLPLVGSLFDIQRRYISEGVFKSVEIVKSDAEGLAKAHFDVEGVEYRISITQDGSIIDTFDNVKVLCDNEITGECNINLNSFASQTDFTDWEQYGNIVFESSFDDRDYTVSFNTVDGTPTNVTITTSSVDGSETELCTSSIYTSSGVLSCSVPGSFGNGTVLNTISLNELDVSQELNVISSNPKDNFGVDAYVFAFILVVSFPLMMISSPIGIIFGLVLGVLGSIGLLLIDNTGLIGPTSAFTWLIVAAGIIIYKMMRREV